VHGNLQASKEHNHANKEEKPNAKEGEDKANGTQGVLYIHEYPRQSMRF